MSCLTFCTFLVRSDTFFHLNTTNTHPYIIPLFWTLPSLCGHHLSHFLHFLGAFRHFSLEHSLIFRRVFTKVSTFEHIFHLNTPGIHPLYTPLFWTHPCPCGHYLSHFLHFWGTYEHFWLQNAPETGTARTMFLAPLHSYEHVTSVKTLSYISFR